MAAAGSSSARTYNLRHVHVMCCCLSSLIRSLSSDSCLNSLCLCKTVVAAGGGGLLAVLQRPVLCPPSFLSEEMIQRWQCQPLDFYRANVLCGSVLPVSHVARHSLLFYPLPHGAPIHQGKIPCDSDGSGRTTRTAYAGGVRSADHIEMIGNYRCRQVVSFSPAHRQST